MANSSRFVVAVHVLTLMAHEVEHDEQRTLTSDFFAASVNTNPVFIRRIVGLLSKSGLVVTTEGAGGGTALAVSPEKITLADVFNAVEQGDLFSFPQNDPNQKCCVGRTVQSILRDQVDSFQGLMKRAMAKVTIADMLLEVKFHRKY
jgi:Rrf2 family protein